MNNEIFRLFAIEAIGQVQKEIEKCYFGKIADPEELKKADSVVRIEQWEIRSPYGLMRVRAYNDEKYEYCVKLFKKDAEGNQARIEKEMDIDKEFFEMIRSLSVQGSLKDRYEFKVPDSDLVWEVDVYRDAETEDSPIIWCKVDLEVPAMDTPIPEFPITFSEHFDQDNCDEEWSQFKRELFDKKYNRNNPLNIQTAFKEEALDVPTLTAEEVAKKHGVEVSAVEEQIAVGLTVESEHTTDPAKQREIALDHISEMLDYYIKLKNMEAQNAS